MKSKKWRRFVSDRARGCCEYYLSQAKYAPDPFSIEHVFPRSKGGTDDLDNLAWACMGCNGMKYNETHAIDPVSMEEVALFHPASKSGLTISSGILPVRMFLAKHPQAGQA